MAKTYRINNTQPTTYIDKTKGVVNGILVQYTMLEFDEAHELRTPTMDAVKVKEAIEEAIKQRKLLDAD